MGVVMGSENYIQMMRESLEKKEDILKKIEQKNIDQQNILLDPNADPDDFDATIDAKGSLIEELEKLDAGFEKLFSEVETELKDNKESYKDEIKRMQELIGIITDS
ncbi:MAG: flagellar protein FliT, partial [Lachnospiraceae bacterium]|nr:flagellar protein FliT [Lachnospiraceae bacterium]